MKVSPPVIRFHVADRSAAVKQRKKLKLFIHGIFLQEGIVLKELHYIFCSDAYLLPLNQNFLKHDTYTDIITFTLSDPSQPIVSDVYISVDRVRHNAASLHAPFSHELHRVIFHGALHLCGYRDKTKAEKEAMRQKEDFYLTQYFVPRDTVSNRNSRDK